MTLILCNGYWQEQTFKNIKNIQYEYQPNNGDSMWLGLTKEDGETLYVNFDPYMDKFEIYK